MSKHRHESLAIDDKASAQLMDYFYHHIVEGLPKDEALRQAKLAYLETASIQKAYPFFWSNFVLVGNAEPIVEKQPVIRLWTYAIGGALLLFCLIGIVTGTDNDLLPSRLKDD